MVYAIIQSFVCLEQHVAARGVCRSVPENEQLMQWWRAGLHRSAGGRDASVGIAYGYSSTGIAVHVPVAEGDEVTTFLDKAVILSLYDIE